MQYKQDRDNLFTAVRQEDIFTWDFMYGQEYALATTCQVSRDELAEIAYATEKLGGIFAKVVMMLQQACTPLLVELGIPAKTFAAVRLPILAEWPTLIGRFDFARTATGLKMLEFNSDTPGGIVEAFYLNGKVCKYYGYSDVNRGFTRHITEAFGAAVSEYRFLGYPVDNIVFSALDWHEEDAGTARYLMNCSGLTACFAPLKDLRIYQDRLWRLTDGQLQPIDVLYRLHPLGVMCEETDQDGYPTGEHLISLVSKKKLAIINPPGALLAQTKALQALIWLLYENNEFFTPAEHEIIVNYMLPTYLENKFLGRRPYVTKPVLGREGGAVIIYDSQGRLIDKDSNECYWEQKMIYQEYAELEQITVETLTGYYHGSLLWGSFLIGGKASAVNARVGGRITDDLSYFLSVRLNETF